VNGVYFRDFYKALTAGAGTTVTLLKQDGTALTSFPTTELAGKTWLPKSSPWYGIVARRQPESFVTPGALAPGLRVVSVHPLADYPLVVNVSVSEWDLLANWRKAALLAAIGTGSAVLCMIFLMRALTLQLQRLERSVPLRPRPLRPASPESPPHQAAAEAAPSVGTGCGPLLAAN